MGPAGDGIQEACSVNVRRPNNLKLSWTPGARVRRRQGVADSSTSRWSTSARCRTGPVPQLFGNVRDNHSGPSSADIAAPAHVSRRAIAAPGDARRSTEERNLSDFIHELVSQPFSTVPRTRSSQSDQTSSARRHDGNRPASDEARTTTLNNTMNLGGVGPRRPSSRFPASSGPWHQVTVTGCGWREVASRVKRKAAGSRSIPTKRSRHRDGRRDDRQDRVRRPRATLERVRLVVVGAAGGSRRAHPARADRDRGNDLGEAGSRARDR